jgi:hypothetical protein
MAHHRSEMTWNAWIFISTPLSCLYKVLPTELLIGIIIAAAVVIVTSSSSCFISGGGGFQDFSS